MSGFRVLVHLSLNSVVVVIVMVGLREIVIKSPTIQLEKFPPISLQFNT